MCTYVTTRYCAGCQLCAKCCSKKLKRCAASSGGAEVEQAPDASASRWGFGTAAVLGIAVDGARSVGLRGIGGRGVLHDAVLTGDVDVVRAALATDEKHVAQLLLLRDVKGATPFLAGSHNHRPQRNFDSCMCTAIDCTCGGLRVWSARFFSVTAPRLRS